MICPRVLVSAVIGFCTSSIADGFFASPASAPLDFLNTTDVVTKNGYPVESHVVTTQDGYRLTVHRIPGSPALRSSRSESRVPVFLQHGLSVSSDAWVLEGRERGLAFLLADEGYDVWMGNARGNLYSRDHVTISPEDDRFWNFTWHEMGVYDLPAMIDYILVTSNHRQLFYIGHCMGNNMFFVLNSMRPEYNKKFRLMTSLAPTVFSGQQGSFSDTYARLLLWPVRGEIQRRTPGVERFWNTLCRDGSWLQKICVFTFLNLFGYNRKTFNTTLLPLYLTRVQSGTSYKTMEHFIQIFEIERFQLFDPLAQKKGKVSRRPVYDLNLVTAPVVIYYGENDAIIRPKGVFRLRDSLPNVVKTVRVPDDDFTHVDFHFSSNVKQLLYNDLLALLRAH